MYRLSYIRRDTQQLTTTTYNNNNMSAGKSASRPLLPVEETIRPRTLMNCEFRHHAYLNGLTESARLPLTPTTDSRRLYWGKAWPRDGKLLHISCGRGNNYRPEMTMWPAPFSVEWRPHPFNVDWYMTEHNTVANVKKFVGEFY